MCRKCQLCCLDINAFLSSTETSSWDQINPFPLDPFVTKTKAVETGYLPSSVVLDLE